MKSPVYTYKKLNYLYEVKDTYTAGIMLEGWEAKALHEHGGNIETAYCAMKGNSFCMMNSKIMPMANHLLDDIVSVKESRDRILLLNKEEIRKIQEKLATKGWTCVPAKLYRNKKNLWKLEIALVTGKKNWDKREDIKKRDIDRDMKREI
jgi:SsrA-binding protein